MDIIAHSFDLSRAGETTNAENDIHLRILLMNSGDIKTYVKRQYFVKKIRISWWSNWNSAYRMLPAVDMLNMFMEDFSYLVYNLSI